MLIKRPTSGGGQVHDQETAVQRIFHLVRSRALLLSFSTNGKDSTKWYFAHSCARYFGKSCLLAKQHC